MTWNDIYEFFLCPQHGALPHAWILGMASISFLVAYLRGAATTLSKGAATIYAAIRNHLSGC